MIPRVFTVAGPVDASSLGFTDMHEHLLIDLTFYGERFRTEADPRDGGSDHYADAVSLENLHHLRHDMAFCRDNLILDDVDQMAGEVALFAGAGGGTIVDQSATGLSRDLPGLVAIAARTGVNIVTPTGLYAEDSWAARFGDLSIDEYRKYMLDEFENGVEGSSIIPGHIKLAIESLSPQMERLVRAAARAVADTGLSLTVHTSVLGGGSEAVRLAGVDPALWAARLLEDERADPSRVVFAHMQGRFCRGDLRQLVAAPPDGWVESLFDPRIPRELLNEGHNISIDCFGRLWDVEGHGDCWPGDWLQAACLVWLVQHGYSRQVVVGCDVAQKIDTRRYGGGGYARLVEYVPDTLRMAGVEDEDIDAITVTNPARILAVKS